VEEVCVGREYIPDPPFSFWESICFRAGHKTAFVKYLTYSGKA